MDPEVWSYIQGLREDLGHAEDEARDLALTVRRLEGEVNDLSRRVWSSISSLELTTNSLQQKLERLLREEY